MSTAQKNGTGSKVDAKNPTDTAKGVAAMAIAETPNNGKEVKIVVSPIDEKMNKIAAINRLIEKRKNLHKAAAELAEFERELKGEGETITLYSKDGDEVNVEKPDAVKKLLGILKTDVEQALAQTEQEILGSAA